MSQVNPVPAPIASTAPQPSPKTTPAKNPVEIYWKIGAVLALIAALLNLLKVLTIYSIGTGFGPKSAREIQYWILGIQIGLGLLLALGLFTNQGWAKWLAWIYAGLAAIGLFIIGYATKSNAPIPGIAYYVMAACILIGWLLMLDNNKNKAVNTFGAVLASLPVGLALLGAAVSG